MRRVAHQLSRNERSSGYPEHLLVYDTETRNQPTPEDPVVTAELKYGYAIWTRVSRGTREDREFTTADEFWDFVEARTKERDVLWVVAHNAKNFDLAVLEYESQLSRRGWSIGGTPVLPTDGQGPLKVTASKGKRKVCLADLANWYGTVPLERIGRSVGVHKIHFETDDERDMLLRAEPGDPLWETLKAYARQDVEVVLAAVLAWVAFLRQHDLGNFAVSLAGQALQAYRHRFMGDHEILLHNSERALELEREAYNGAVVDCYRVGTYVAETGSFHVVDVNSEYPHVMKEEKYPVRLVDFERVPTFRKVRRLLAEDMALIARVKIDTDQRPDLSEREVAIVPTIWDGKLIYPTGRFTTTLCTGELRQALEMGIVAEVERMAVYAQDRIFTEYVDFFYGLRMEAQARGDDTADALAKLFMNSLYGKFGQRNYQWETLEGQRLDEPGVAVVINSQTGEVETWRQLGDLCQRRSKEREEGHNSFCAIAAHATSYARMTILRYRRTAGLDHTLYTDTDSLIVDDEGLRRLQEAGAIGRELGRLKVEEEVPEVTITAPKNYRCGSKVRHKGRRKDAVLLSAEEYLEAKGATWEDLIDQGPDPWPGLLTYVRSRGGLRTDVWSPGIIPPPLRSRSRRTGAVPDLVAAEMPTECAEAAGLWDPIDGSEAMLAALGTAYEAHKRRRRRKPLAFSSFSSGYYRQIQFRGLAGAFRARDPNHAVLSLIVKRGDLPYAKGTVDPDGWTRPHRLETWDSVTVLDV